MKDQKRARRAARRDLICAGDESCWNITGRDVCPVVGPWNEPGRSIVGTELVDHEDEADEGPVKGLAVHVDVEALGG
jgi:hypothetical protein